MYTMEDIEAVDMEIAQAIKDEFDRQNSHIELIASENWVSPAVMSAMGSVLTNKYAEGYPGKRYYGGCDCVDVVEELARERAKKLFSCDYVNVQPHSGAQAEYGSAVRCFKAGRHRDGYEPGSWRTPYAWLTSQFFRNLFSYRTVRCK